MPKSGTIRVPDREAMDNVTELQLSWGQVFDWMRTAADTSPGPNRERALAQAFAALQRADSLLYHLGLLGDTAKLASYE